MGRFPLDRVCTKDVYKMYCMVSRMEKMNSTSPFLPWMSKTAVTPDKDCDQTAIGLPPATPEELVFIWRLGVISEIILYPPSVSGVYVNCIIYYIYFCSVLHS
jgi:hypothetical protein